MAQQSVFDRHHGGSSPGAFGSLIFILLLIVGMGYAGSQLVGDLEVEQTTSWLPFILLGVALLIALGFEFVNGFHDTANAVATVIYTHSLPPTIAVAWSGLWNFLGVLTSSGLVAFGIISLLPVELILQVGSSAGFAMVFALLIAAIIWNLGTWYFGLPSSSSHTLIGSIIGVGLMNQLLAPAGTATSGVDWGKATEIGYSLLLSPLVGFAAAALLLLAAKALIRQPALYKAPEGKNPPPLWIRGLLVLTCTGVSFAHGSNDGQKGMGLIMLILIGTVPTAYALNRAVPESEIAAFASVTAQVSTVMDHYIPQGAAAPAENGRAQVQEFVRSHTLAAETPAGVKALAQSVSKDITTYGSIAAIPAAQVGNVRNDMYLLSESLRLMLKAGTPAFTADEIKVLKTYKGELDDATKFIPDWVKVAVAIALGLGTMVGWKRIVVTVGEKIGKDHLTYAQGGSAELVAMATIGAADVYGLPVSTTHVLSSGVAGTMAANGSGLQMATVRNMLMAWLLTLPVSIVLSGSLFWLFRNLF
ncbi:anion permease [Oleomonas cavernae]|uniref:Phosphate transporter n=1 Tax=Oleomonas cavernae TaxID=2320859 RepID=A0A418WGI0_9PROT|nr:inorganic phosphate transporter [Oleomonas cavernae]RJF89154.1 anion permease [Oleomonas cavernae]